MKCAVFHCDSILTKSARLDTCQKCRSVFHYWERPDKGVKAIILRQRQLSKWQDRMSYLGEHKNPKKFHKALPHVRLVRGPAAVIRRHV